MFRLFYDPAVWSSLDIKTLVDITDIANPLYPQALQAALAGAEKVHPLANRYSAKTEQGITWHICFRAINAAANPQDNTIRGFVYVPMTGLDGYVRVSLSQQDSDQVLGIINNHYRMSNGFHY
ncbi:hypothetical protein [Aquicella siphonis]|nr:hypothetical protein [Aquicella siphonis]